MSKAKFKDIITAINESPSGGYVGITDYVSENLSVVSVTGRIGTSYGDMKALAIQGLKDAIENEDFEAMAMKALEEAGLPQDEAERMLEDINI